jgi:5-methylcytosine-specific restriction endonuclease McrA
LLNSKCRKCGTLILYRTTYCDTCKGIKERERKDRYNKYNREDEIRKLRHTTKWRKLRLEILEKTNGLCYCCYIKGKYIPADHVHHITPANINISMFFDRDNLVPLCSTHHEFIHTHKIESMAIFKRYIDTLK